MKRVPITKHQQAIKGNIVIGKGDDRLPILDSYAKLKADTEARVSDIGDE
jgi:hypothetical protein